MSYGLIWWVIGLPILGFLVQCLFGKSLIDALGPTRGKWFCGLLAVIPIAAAFTIGVAITQSIGAIPNPGHRHIVETLFDWISLKSLQVPCEVLIDPLSMTMVLIITGIGSLIHLYATGYMSEEKDYPRFFCYLNLFIACMLVLVLGNNLVMLFVGWEGVGLCSYLLIGFWYKDLANARAANKAFIVNRIGDWGLTLGMFLLLFVVAGSNLGADQSRWLSYDVILPNAIDALTNQPMLAGWIAFLFFVGAMGKSAQFPLYMWLPDAMAGPTPVSALIHAATMVTAGVFLLNRVHVLFEMSPFASAVVAMVGAFTALFAAVVAFGQTDIKKVLAYSTVSQLGFMFLGCGAGAYWTGMFHVTTHAFFKALLFLGAGAVIHAMAHNQDMRNYGGLRKYLPITFATMFIGFIAIAGLAIPEVFGFSGFYSKEAILGHALAGRFAEIQGVQVAYWAGWAGLFVALLTAMYMTRMTWLTFFGPERWRQIPAAEHAHDHAHEHAHHEHEEHGPDVFDFYYTEQELVARDHAEGHDHHHALDAAHKPREVPISMWLPLVLLAIPSAIAGWYLAQNNRFLDWLYPAGPDGQRLTLLNPELVEGHPHLPVSLVWLSFIAATGGVLLGWLVYRKGLPSKEGWDLARWSPFRRAAGEQFGYDELVVDIGVKGGGLLALFCWKIIDGIIDGMVNATGYIVQGFGGALRSLQTGYVRAYALLMLAGVVGVLGWFLYALTRTG